MAVNDADRLVVSGAPGAGTYLLQPRGPLDSSTYRQLRDTIVTAAIEYPDGVIVDVTSLEVPAPSAWSVFTSARWHTRRWPAAPMALVCTERKGREAIAVSRVTRYLPVFESVADAVAALHSDRNPGLRQRERCELSRTASSAPQSRELMAQWLTAWSRPELIAVAKLVVTVFVENVLVHTESMPTVRLDGDGDVVTVAVDDNSPVLATRRERSKGGCEDVSGTAIVAALCRSWGNAPTSTGKTVWAIIGPENRL